ncbi:hypothetical protein PoB_000706500 [Plakobranchus ocellatus]|uniref:DDE Tnp4 domain-containing protein n=1 Tax=Plakobranchus ocellatus TaxID=259542 RepID=A0AAV3YDF7_9GAST|nr:hypothetical protein PoB_000706500 [Plakobranchus ocellatus]
MTPNGLFAHMFGPMEGRRHDAAMFHESGIMTMLEETMNRPDSTPLFVWRSSISVTAPRNEAVHGRTAHTRTRGV